MDNYHGLGCRGSLMEKLVMDSSLVMKDEVLYLPGGIVGNLQTKLPATAFNVSWHIHRYTLL